MLLMTLSLEYCDGKELEWTVSIVSSEYSEYSEDRHPHLFFEIVYNVFLYLSYFLINLLKRIIGG